MTLGVRRKLWARAGAAGAGGGWVSLDSASLADLIFVDKIVFKAERIGRTLS